MMVTSLNNISETRIRQEVEKKVSSGHVELR